MTLDRAGPQPNRRNVYIYIYTIWELLKTIHHHHGITASRHHGIITITIIIITTMIIIRITMITTIQSPPTSAQPPRWSSSSPKISPSDQKQTIPPPQWHRCCQIYNDGPQLDVAKGKCDICYILRISKKAMSCDIWYIMYLYLYWYWYLLHVW